MIRLPDQYVVEKFCQFSGYPKYNKRANTWQAGCPMCREGTSWGKKRRLYYKLDKNYVFCFNCSWKGSTLDYVKHITGLTVEEIVRESLAYDTNNISVVQKDIGSSETIADPHDVPSLPTDSINLFDKQQVSYWLSKSDDTSHHNKVIKDAVSYVKSRLLDVSINKPKTLWVSLNDFTHKNRIILPFYNNENKIIFYQSRSVYNTGSHSKYLSKSGGAKSIFNIDNVDRSLDSIFLFEGPIDSCFVKNGLGVAGISNGPDEDLNPIQQKQISEFRLYNKIWVLDSQWLDDTSYMKSKLLISQGYTVFIWPESIGRRYKDINELCMDINTPGIGHKFIIKNSHTGLKASLLLANIPSNR